MNGCIGIKRTEMNVIDTIINQEKEMAIVEKAHRKEEKWREVIKLAEEYGFIRFTYAGFAMLSINEEAMRNNGL